MRILFKILFFALIAFNLVLSSWSVLHTDIAFHTDIARDFWLLREVDTKKVVLIGPKSSTGLFHGPLWLYLNYPAYKIGHGNPVVVGWYWIFLIIIFLFTSFYIAKKLFDTTTAYFFTLMLSVYMVFHANALYNPHGALFFTPAYFFSFIKYLETHKRKFLLLHILVSAFLIEFQLAVGLPLTLLSFLYIVIHSFRTNTKKNILYLSLILIPLSNFILFDIRHEFLLLKTALGFLSTHSGGKTFDYLLYLPKRIEMMIGGVEILRRDPGNRNLILFSTLIAFLIFQIKDKKNRRIYFSFLYFYYGFFILSLINKGDVLYFYFYPLFPLCFLVFSSFITSRFKKIFVAVFFIVLLMNEQNAINDIQEWTNSMGRSMYSWKFLYTLSQKVYVGDEKELGYFVYSPDVVGHEAQYAMYYAGVQSNKTFFRSQKKKITYLVIAPPPRNNPYMKDEWWRINQVGIESQPVSTTNFENGYKIEKYELTDEDIKISFDPNIDPGIFFR